MNERGFSLMETIVSTVIAVIAIMGMAYSFGLGRAWIDRYEVARSADAVAQGRMEWLGTLAPNDINLGLGAHLGVPFLYHGNPIGALRWQVDPADAAIPGHAGLHKVTVVVAWAQAGLADSITYNRMVASP